MGSLIRTQRATLEFEGIGIMSKPIFSSYGVEIFKELLGYRMVFESGGHGGGLLSLSLSREDAEKAMRGPDEAAEVLDRLGSSAKRVGW